jgi:hypothetical protein
MKITLTLFALLAVGCANPTGPSAVVAERLITVRVVTQTTRTGAHDMFVLRAASASQPYDEARRTDAAGLASFTVPADKPVTFRFEGGFSVTVGTQVDGVTVLQGAASGRVMSLVPTGEPRDDT